MLVLTRKPGEKILIGDNITFVVLEVTRHKVRLGIEAPRDVLVLRDELCGTVAKAMTDGLMPSRELQHAVGNP